MGEADKLPLKPIFNGSVSVEARPEQLTAASEAPLFREIDERLSSQRSRAFIVALRSGYE
ncbi:MAG: hypothetical protein J7M25_08220 [Deltaproteobacteria bacterium]|nr:hypothetical protein [Deltaproteobacteria bacterium]